MNRIHRSAGRLLAIVAAAALAACASDDVAAPPGDARLAPAIAGEWVLATVDAKPLPAQVAAGNDSGVAWSVNITADTLRITSDGRWVQRAWTRVPQSDGQTYHFTYYDHGTVQVVGNEVRFESDWIENVRFAGTLQPNGRLVLQQNLLLDDEIGTLRLELQK